MANVEQKFVTKSQLARYFLLQTSNYIKELKKEKPTEYYNQVSFGNTMSFSKGDYNSVTTNIIPNTTSVIIDNSYANTFKQINSIYETLGVTSANFTVKGKTTLANKDLQPGDLLKVLVSIDNQVSTPDRITQSTYYVLVTDVSNNRISLFPEQAKNTFNIDIIEYYSLNTDKLTDQVKEIIYSASNNAFTYVSNDELSAEIVPTQPYNLPGLLQVGDIRFIVGPTQISFSTQNGYQYFPTLRTQGNPKIPTMQETKSINVTLIFPNASSINNQLLPLYAMIRRAPFVNIYNVDISNFFSEIKDDEDFVSVALESIQIQSIKGFPNSLQANLTMLPFQREAVNSSFKALKTFDDVKYQQLKRGFVDDEFFKYVEASAARLYNREAYYTTDVDSPVSKDGKVIETKITSDFTLSEPFRAYYQGMLYYRDVVCDEMGNVIQKRMKDNTYEAIPLTGFRPSRPENYIYEYIPSHNNKPVTIGYKYIATNIRDYVKQANDNQQKALTNVAKSNRATSEMLMATDSSFANNLSVVVRNRTDLYKAISAQFKSFDNFITDYFSLYNIDIQTPATKEIKNISSLLFEAAINNWKIDNVSIRALANVGGVVLGNSQYKATLNTNQRINILQGQTVYSETDLKKFTADDFIELMSTKMKEAYSKLSDEKTTSFNLSQKEIFCKFWDELVNIVTSPAGTIDLNTMMTVNIEGVTEAIFQIDGVNDVIDGWGITFSNKFVPMQLLGFKYPFYQHIGSDDINISLSITSLQNGRDGTNGNFGLKEQLSMLNDRIQNTTKIILLSAPELINTFDKSLNISNIGEGNIFNVFGLKKVIYNNSNISNINSLPNAWSITVNLTQDAFTLRDYQSISRVPNKYGFTDELVNKLLRSRYNTETKKIEVIEYAVNKSMIDQYVAKLTNNTTINTIKKLLPGFDYDSDAVLKASQDETPIPETIGRVDSTMTKRDKDVINQLIMSIESNAVLIDALNENGFDVNGYEKTAVKTNWIPPTFENVVPIAVDYMLVNHLTGDAREKAAKEAAIARINQEQARATTPIVYKNADDIRNIFTSRVSVTETNELQALLYGNTASTTLDSPFVVMYKNLMYQIKTLYETEASILMLKYKEVDDPNIKVLIAQLIGSGAAGVLGGIGLAVVAGATIGTIIPVAIGLGVIGLLSGASIIGSNANIEKTAQDFLIENETAIKSMFNRIKDGYVSKLARLVAKDPFILGKLFGEKYVESLWNAVNSFGVNCYKDFDVNLSVNNVLNGTQLLFTPDFYILQSDVSESMKMEYVKDELKRKMTAAEIQGYNIMSDYQKIIKQIDTMQDIMFTTSQRDKEIYAKIKADLKIKTTSSSTADESNETDRINIDSIIKDLSETYVSIVNKYSGTQVTDDTGHTTTTNTLSLDGLKFNMLVTARLRRILELKLIETQINNVLADKNEKEIIKENALDTAMNSVKSTAANAGNAVLNTLGVEGAEIDYDQNQASDSNPFSLVGLSTKSLVRYKGYIDQYFTKFISVDTMKTTPIAKTDGKVEDGIFKDNSGMVYNPNGSNGTITGFELQIFTRLHQLAILDSSIQAAVANEGQVQDISLLEEIPEMTLLKWFNYRQAEQSIQDLAMLQDFQNSQKLEYNRNSRRLFPTQKIYFIEEDSKIFKNLDDYYSYDAIQSIDIVANKYSAGKTAVLRLGNLFNNLTDKMSLMTEYLDATNRSIENPDNIFLGTLDIKPGTKIVIKQGYEANDKRLPVVFVGKIVEMNPGPVTEMICQSYGAQLNHYIETLNFGFVSSKNEHGDVAMAVLDQIIGLDGLGKEDPLGISVGKFTGKNIQRMQDDVKDFGRFLISNIVSRVNIGLFSSDNPRDDNIFLPINLIIDMWNKVTFDWIVYQQTAWQALSEISLFHNNCFPMVKFYNNDVISSLDELRETIVVGNKAGYYKYTDAFTYSSINYNQITNAITVWNTQIKDTLADIIELIASTYYFGQLKNKNITKDQYIRVINNATQNNDLAIFRSEKLKIGKYKTSYVSASTKQISEEFKNKYLAILVIKKYVDRKVGTENTKSLGSLLANILQQTIFNITGIFNDINITGMNELLKVYTYNSKLLSTDMSFYTFDQISAHTFNIHDNIMLSLLYGLTLMSITNQVNDKGEFIGDFVVDTSYLREELKYEDYLMVEPIVTDNTDSSLVGNLQYKRIQTHHLITDSSDILSNNLVVSQGFNNAVRVYFSDEPNFYNSLDGMPTKKQKQLKSITIKSFGDINDGNTRVLETYQKNIDTNYFDISDSLNSLMSDYQGTVKFDSADDILNKKSGDELKFKQPTFERLPAFYKVALGLLQREVEQMYRGTIQLVGNPYIQPFDIIHLDDMMNNMVGVIEVEEVIHTFNPQQGYITTIVPSMITYNRDPIRLSEVQTMTKIFEVGKQLQKEYQRGAIGGAIGSGIGAGISIGAGIWSGFSGNALGLALSGIGLATSLGFGAKSIFEATTFGSNIRFTSFLYDQFANVFGRDCINFSALTYHGAPLIGGFGGVDYTDIKTIINHQSTQGGWLQRIASANDREYIWIASSAGQKQMDLLTTASFASDNSDRFGGIFKFISPMVRAGWVATTWGKGNNINLKGSVLEASASTLKLGVY